MQLLKTSKGASQPGKQEWESLPNLQPASLCDRKELDSAHSFQAPYHYLSLEILLVAPQA